MTAKTGQKVEPEVQSGRWVRGQRGVAGVKGRGRDVCSWPLMFSFFFGFSFLRLPKW